MKVLPIVVFLAPIADAFLGGTLSLTHQQKMMKTSNTLLQMSVPTPLDTLTSGLASLCRYQRGVTVSSASSRDSNPRLLVNLFDVENHAACRRVRERLSELDLNVERVIPATANSRAVLDETYPFKLPKGAQVPRLVVQDASGKQTILEGASTILSFLNDEYDDKTSDQEENSLPPNQDFTKTLTDAALEIGNVMANLFRLGRGVLVSEAASSSAVEVVPRPQQPLILYSYEGNQFCRLVREVLTELDIVYELRSVAKESKRRDELAQVANGSTQSPFLIDPNTGVQMSESTEIIQYLYRTYALWTPPNEVLQGISDLLLPWFRPLFNFLTPLQAGSLDADQNQYHRDMSRAKEIVREEAKSAPVVIYTYELSPYSIEAKKLLDNLAVDYKEISLGGEWLPGLIGEGGAQKRAALLELTGQSSLPNIFIGGKCIGGLFSGSPGLVPLLERGEFRNLLQEAIPSTDSLLSEMARKMAKPYSEFEAEQKLTKEKLQRALNMTDAPSNTNDAVEADAFW